MIRAVAAGLLILAAMGAAAEDIAFVTAQSANEVAIVELDSGTVRVVVPVPDAPAPVAYDAARGRAAVIAAETGELTLLDTGGAVLGQVGLGEGAFGLAFAPDGDLFVVDWYGARLRRLDPSGQREIWSAPTGKAPAGVALSDDGRIVAVADRDDDRVSGFDAATGQALWKAGTGSHPYAVAFHEGRFWTTDVQSRSVTVLDAATGARVGSVATGDHPYGMAFAAGRGFVTDQYAGTVTVFDPVSLETLGSIGIGDYPEGIAALSDGRRLAVASWDSDELSIIDGATLAIERIIDVPSGPRSFGLFVGPDR
ncbi:YncE family protein [Paracoccus sp. MC1862]|uniref:YncE family protein n=1 Tax=Paracoccus sp. MC1862 TaxID=2760307 RepID=UPI00160373C8|nr:PQQ-binding-like beta-propeller repeat protein [Paracoccus sp. MC1862]MBB1497919.1 PQQ-binding-like beta-propeller repeat protein [Paracoccus sp. MC1862]QQO44309.1 PQQ-binding-like beta-propeller repeat protein [Paracoccus sp. MC1862]